MYDSNGQQRSCFSPCKAENLVFILDAVKIPINTYTMHDDGRDFL